MASNSQDLTPPSSEPVPTSNNIPSSIFNPIPLPTATSMELSLATKSTSSTHNEQNKPQRQISKKPTSVNPISKLSFKPSKPMLITHIARTKYKKIRAHIQTGFPVVFDVHAGILELFKNIGWECLVMYNEACIYPDLLCEFFANMTPIKNESGHVLYIETMIDNKFLRITEDLLVKALKLSLNMLEMKKENCYLNLQDESVESLLAFQLHLSTVCDSVISPNMFTAPQNTSPIYFTATSQFLARIIKTNFMPHRKEKLIEPTNLYLMHSILTGNVTFGLPYFILLSLYACYENNFVGYGLLLNKVFKHIRLKLYTETPMLVQPPLIGNKLFVPPRPLSLFVHSDQPMSLDEQDVSMQLEIINGVQFDIIDNQLILHSNQLTIHNELMSIQATLGNVVSKLQELQNQIALV